MGRFRGSDESDADVFINEFSERSEFGLGKGVHGADGRRGTFFQIDLQIVRPMRSKGVGFLFTEDVSKVMILFGDVSKIWRLVRDSGRFSRDGRVRDVNSKTLRTR